jgi:carboxyl-terminal processing protease
MKSVKFLPFALLILCMGFCQANYTEGSGKYTLISKAINETIRTMHYSPKELDDKFSESVFDEYIKRLDYFKRFLLKSDLDMLEKYKDKIDNEISESSLEFFEATNDLIVKRIKEAEAYYTEILAKPFDFKVDEEYIIDPKDYDFAKTAKELKEYWRKTLKYEVLARLTGDLEMQEKAIENKDTILKIKPFDSLEKNAREKLVERYKSYFHRLEQNTEDDRFADYMNSIAMVNDPHTNYFPPKDKEDFDISISGSLEGIGAILTQKDEFVKVESVVPGGPAYKQGELKPGDLILKVAQGTAEPVDVVDMRLDDAVRLIRGKKGSEVRLTVRKPDGKVTLVKITRDVVYREDAFAKSSVIESQSGIGKIGYIRLPSFYMDFNNYNGRRSSVDMKEELKKLNKEGIQGLVLDLRDNGGGSLQDAVDIAGLFIESGPVVQVSSKSGSPLVLKDNDPSVYYGGPLVILVNEHSASASEILAAAMQDYGRAVIVGDKSTFGKGTVQRFTALPNAYYNSTEQQESGELKITIQKFYRINGGSTQLKGVVPDVILPDEFNYIDQGEREMDYAMQWDKIRPAEYNTFPLMSRLMDFIKEGSRNRVQSDEQFKLIEENALRFKKLRDIKSYTLNMKKFREQRTIDIAEAKKFEDIGKKEFSFKLANPKADLVQIESDSTFKSKNEAWFKSLKTDLYLNESINILNDMVVLAKKN